MQSVTLSNATRTLAVDQDEYNNLDIADQPFADGSNVMVSLWTPSAEELMDLAKGGAVVLKILGNQHPPVIVTTQRLD
jgi:acetylornithine/succinyldiaminopimelate/putrescine aminotransferase